MWILGISKSWRMNAILPAIKVIGKLFGQKELINQRLLCSSLSYHNSFHLLPLMCQAIYNIILIMLSHLIL